MLAESERKTLIQLARDSIAAGLAGETLPEAPAETEALQQRAGAFVTLRLFGDLRGCTGDISGQRLVGEAVRHAAVNSAFHDPRFPPLTREEFERVTVEISILSPMQPAQPSDVEVGTHGLVIRHGGRAGLLLPQVAASRDWSREQFLEAVCRKAGLFDDAWRRGAELYTFTAEIFGEE